MKQFAKERETGHFHDFREKEKIGELGGVVVVGHTAPERLPWLVVAALRE